MRASVFDLNEFHSLGLAATTAERDEGRGLCLVRSVRWPARLARAGALTYLLDQNLNFAEEK